MVSDSQIDNIITELFDEEVAFLQKLISFNSAFDSSTQSPDSPYGKGVRDCLHFFLNEASKDGFLVKNIENKVGFAELSCASNLPEGNLYGILAHLDTVPVGDIAKWHHDPFKAEIDNGILYGRGTIDDKGPLAASYFAMKALKKLNISSPHRIRLIAGCDEETAMRCVKTYLENNEEVPSFSFSPDSFFPIVNAEKGMMRLTLKREFTFQGYEPIKLLGLTAGDKINIVPDKATAYFSGEIVRFKRQLEEIASADIEAGLLSIDYYKDDYLEVTAFGRASHAMHPEKGDNALIRLFKILANEELDFGSWEFMLWMRDIAPLLTNESIAESLGVLIEDDISGKLTINLGIARYKSEALILKLDIRYPVSLDETGLNSLLENIAKKFMMLGQKGEHIPPLYVDKDNINIQKLLSAYKSIMKVEDAEPIATGGRTYCSQFPNSVSFGADFPSEEALAHQANECIPLDKLKLITKIYLKAYLNLVGA